MNDFEITDEILRLCLYGNISSDLVSYQDFPNLPHPHQVKVGPSTLPGCKYGIFARTTIRTGTEMGPFVGHIKTVDEIHNKNHNPSLWEVYDTNGRLVHFIDGGNITPNSWLSLVQCARSDMEQNLEVIQVRGHLYFKASKDISCGKELLVWYGNTHSLFMGLPLSDRSDSSEKGDNTDILSKQVSSYTKELGKLKCVLCRRGFNSRSNLRSHMRIHTLEKPFGCKYCNRRFSQSSTLRNHVRLHTGEKPYKCLFCKSSYSQLAGLRAHQRSARHRPNQETPN